MQVPGVGFVLLTEPISKELSSYPLLDGCLREWVVV